MVRFKVGFCGHANVRSNHPRTIEVTTSTSLTPAGDCIIGVGAGAGCAGLPEGVKAALRREGARVTCTITAGGHEFLVRGMGHPGLELADAEDMVLRKSSHMCPRTLAILCDVASDDMPREMVAALRDPGTRGTLVISVD